MKMNRNYWLQRNFTILQLFITGLLLCFAGFGVSRKVHEMRIRHCESQLSHEIDRINAIISHVNSMIEEMQVLDPEFNENDVATSED